MSTTLYRKLTSQSRGASSAKGSEIRFNPSQADLPTRNDRRLIWPGWHVIYREMV